MSENIRAALALQHAPTSHGMVRLPEHAKVTDLGIDYTVLSCDINGAVLRRMDETNATVGYTQAELKQCLGRPANPMTVEFGFYSQKKAKMRLTGSASLSSLRPADQEDVIRKEFFVRKYLQLEADYRERRRRARIDGLPAPPAVSTSREALLRLVPTIAQQWRDLQLRTQGRPAATYRSRAKVALFEPKPSTLKGWIKTMRENDFDPVCLKNSYKRDRPEHFTSDEFHYLNEAIKEACSTTRPNLAAIHMTMTEKMEAANRLRGPDHQLRIPVEETLRNRYNALPDMWRELGRDGKESARRDWQPEHAGIDVIRALERAELDDHEIDLQTLLVKVGIWKTLPKAEQKKVRRTRLWISAMICVATRCIIALHVSAEPPSKKSAMTALEMATRDKTDIARRLGCSSSWAQGGTMETLAVDSAVYFAHRPFRVAVNDAGVDLFLPPAGEASMRGFIERWFLTFSTQMFNYFDGRTWGSSAEKGDYDAESHAAAMADQVAECIIRWAVDGYHNAKHSEMNNATPANRWLELARDHGVQPGPTGAMRTHLFGTYVERVISKKGYRVAGLYFQSKQLQQIRRKSKKAQVIGRVNNHNLGAISVLSEQGWIEVPCVFRELEEVSIWQWLAATERLKLFNEDNAKASRQTLLDTFSWLKEQAEMARLEAGLVNPVLTDDDYQRFERKMDRVFDLVDSPVKGEPRPEGEWKPSDELFSALRISPVVYAKKKQSVKEVKEQEETWGRPAVGKISGPQMQREPAPDADKEGSPIRRIGNDIFDND
ncbi:putative transposase [Rhizobium sp. PP-F2F-G36]|nr:putative transposase [Rhizobium sp. PP-F2F-G36]